MDLDRQVDQDRLRNDHEYLVACACGLFQKCDKYHRGLITAAAFAETLKVLGLNYGQKEVSDILQYCTTTDDGYVHYKELLHIVSPATPRAKKSSAGLSIFPQSDHLYVNTKITKARDPNQPRVAAEYTEQIRQLYLKWDRSIISGQQFKEKLEVLGIPVPNEAERMLDIYDTSRHMSYSKFMMTFQNDENSKLINRERNPVDNRRSGRSSPDSSVSGASSVPYFHKPHWEAADKKDQERRKRSDNEGGGSVTVKDCICDFIDGKITSKILKKMLERNGVRINSKLDKVIRTHDVDNCMRFQDFSSALLGSKDRAREPGDRGDDRDRGSRRSDGGSSKADSRYDDDRSQSSPSYATSGRSESSLGGYPANRDRSGDGYPMQKPVHPPWATSGYVEKKQEPRDAPFANSRAYGNNGKILAWEPDVLQPPRPRTFKEVNDCFNWPTSGEQIEEYDVRFGKRFYGQAPPAADCAPYGRASDLVHAEYLSPGGKNANQGRSELAKPFGTERDHGLKRPEDAGTDEYRAQAKHKQGAMNFRD